MILESKKNFKFKKNWVEFFLSRNYIQNFISFLKIPAKNYNKQTQQNLTFYNYK